MPKIERVVLIGLVLGLTWGGSPAKAQGVWNFSNLRPTGGPWGTVVSLIGYGFKRGIKVYYAGNLVKPMSVSGTRIKVRVPPGSRSGWFELEQGGRQLRAPVLFTIKNTPVVTRITPARAPPGVWITVQGKHFDRSMRFWIGRAPLRRRLVSETIYKLLIHGAVQTGPLYYQHNGRKRRSRLVFRLINIPLIKRFAPRKGYFGDRITLHGQSFCPKARVRLGGVLLPIAHRHGTTRLVIRLPKGVRSGPFSLECFGKRTVSPAELTVEPPYAWLTHVSPQAGEPGRWIYLHGKGFTAKDRFWLGSRLLRQQVRSPSQVRVFIPKQARTAPIHFESYGRRFKSSFGYEIRRPPIVTGFSPPAAWLGERVTLKGRQLCSTAEVYLGGRRLTVIERVRDRSLVVRVPQGASPEKLTVRCYQWSVTTKSKLRIEPPKARLSVVEPAKGRPGTEVTFRGLGLTRHDKILLAGLPLPITWKSPTTITAVVPRTAKSGAVVLVSFNRKIATGLRFVVAWPRPKIIWYRPRGIVSRNEVVTVAGRRFCAHPRVTLGGWKAEVIYQTPTALRFKIPAKSNGGRIAIKCHVHLVLAPGWLKVR